MDIIMKFVSMSAIARFDDMYANALKDEKMTKAIGKSLPIEYKRYMSEVYDQKQLEKEKKDKDHGMSILEGNLDQLNVPLEDQED